MRLLGLGRRRRESLIDDIIKAVQHELTIGIGRCMGIKQIWQRLRIDHHLSVKRYLDLLIISHESAGLKGKTTEVTNTVEAVDCDI